MHTINRFSCYDSGQPRPKLAMFRRFDTRAPSQLDPAARAPDLYEQNWDASPIYSVHSNPYFSHDHCASHPRPAPTLKRLYSSQTILGPVFPGARIRCRGSTQGNRCSCTNTRTRRCAPCTENKQGIKYHTEERTTPAIEHLLALARLRLRQETISSKNS